MSNDSAPAANPLLKTLVAAPSRGRGLALCALVVALLTAGGGWIWIARIYAPDLARIEDALASSDRAYTGLGGELRGLYARLTTAQSSQDTRDTQLAALAAEVARLTRQLAAPVALGANWLRFARIEHLVKSADISLRLGRDRASAEAALIAAQAELDRRIPLEAALHQTLRADEAAIASVTEPDVGALSAQWADNALQTEFLPWRGGAATAPAAGPLSTAPAAGWRGVATAVWHDLLRLVEIRSTTVADEGLLDPAREALIKAGLQIEITTLRGALERRDTRAAHTSAAAMTRTLKTYFEVNDMKISALLADLASLASTELAPVLPALTASLRAVQALQQANPLIAPTTEAGVPEISAPRSDLPQLAPRDFM